MTTILQPAENSQRGVVVLEHSCCLAPMSPDEIRIRREAHHEYNMILRMEDEEERNMASSISQSSSSPRIYATTGRKTTTRRQNKSTGWNRFYNLSRKVGVEVSLKPSSAATQPTNQQRRKTTKHGSRPNRWLHVGSQQNKSQFPSQ